jgi:hypothetical protein
LKYFFRKRKRPEDETSQFPEANQYEICLQSEQNLRDAALISFSLGSSADCNEEFEVNDSFERLCASDQLVGFPPLPLLVSESESFSVSFSGSNFGSPCSIWSSPSTGCAKIRFFDLESPISSFLASLSSPVGRD